VVKEFDDWNYMTTSALAVMKSGIVADRIFLRKMVEVVTPYFQPLIPWLDKLRRIVFQNWEGEDEELYEKMKQILRRAMDDPAVKAEWTR
jgi:hypothetical protein